METSTISKTIFHRYVHFPGVLFYFDATHNDQQPPELFRWLNPIFLIGQIHVFGWFSRYIPIVSLLHDLMISPYLYPIISHYIPLSFMFSHSSLNPNFSSHIYIYIYIYMSFSTLFGTSRSQVCSRASWLRPNSPNPPS